MLKRYNITVLVILLLIMTLIFVINVRKKPFPQYQFIDLGTLGGDCSCAFAINNDGFIVGRSETRDKKIHPFFWEPNEGMIDLEEFVGEPNCWAAYITNSGLVINVGVKFCDWRFLYRYFIWDSKTGKVYDMQKEVGEYCCISDITNSCQVVGYYDFNDKDIHSFYWDPCNGMIDFDETLIPPEKDCSNPYVFEINEKGQAIGNWHSERYQKYGFIWDIHNGVKYLHTDDPNLSAFSINDQCQIVGRSPSIFSYGSKYPHLENGQIEMFDTKYFYLENGQIETIDDIVKGYDYVEILEDGRYLTCDIDSKIAIWSPKSQSRYKVKNLYYFQHHGNGLFTGSYKSFWLDDYSPFVIIPEVGVLKLNNFSFSGDGYKKIEEACGINNKGQIVGCAKINKGINHAFLLTPKYK